MPSSVAEQADDPYLDASTLTAAITTANGGNFHPLPTRRSSDLTDVTDTTDTTTLTLSAASSVAEGSGTLTYTATLSHAAQGDVTVKMGSTQVRTLVN